MISKIIFRPGFWGLKEYYLLPEAHSLGLAFIYPFAWPENDRNWHKDIVGKRKQIMERHVQCGWAVGRDFGLFHLLHANIFCMNPLYIDKSCSLVTKYHVFLPNHHFCSRISLFLPSEGSFTTYLKLFQIPNGTAARPEGETYEKMVLPVLSPDPNTDDTCLLNSGSSLMFFLSWKGNREKFIQILPKWQFVCI